MTLLNSIKKLPRDTAETILSLYTVADIQDMDRALRTYGIKLSKPAISGGDITWRWRKGIRSGNFELWFGTNRYLFMALWGQSGSREACLRKRPGLPLEDRWLDWLMGDPVPWSVGPLMVPFRTEAGVRLQE